MEDAHICMDTIPAHPTASNCRIYSIDPSPDNVLFELKVNYINGYDAHRVRWWDVRIALFLMFHE